MFAVAPASVMLMGVLGLVVLGFSVLRMSVLERRTHARPVVVEARIPVQRQATRASA